MLRPGPHVLSDSGGRPADGQLEAEFHRAMTGLHERTKRETDYSGTYFARMVAELGGVEAARRLVTTSKPSVGFTRLWELERLDLSVEAHVVDPRFAPIFTRREVDAARLRLEQYGFGA